MGNMIDPVKKLHNYKISPLSFILSIGLSIEKKLSVTQRAT